MAWYDVIHDLRKERGWSQSDLARAAGISQAALAKIEKGAVRETKALPAIAKALGVTVYRINPDLPQPSLLEAYANMDLEKAEKLANDPRILARVAGVGGEVPVYQAVEGGPGEMILEKEPIDYVARPEPLNGVKEGYLVEITGESMVPEFWPGERAIVNPKAPRVLHEPYIFYTNDAHNDRAMIKRLIRVTQDAWTVQQWNPEQSFELDREEWQKCHRVIGKYGRR